MKAIQKFAMFAAASIAFGGLAGCSGMSQQDKNTAIGAGVGGVAGKIKIRRSVPA